MERIKTKKIILLVSFGVMDQMVKRLYIDGLLKKIAANFPDHEVQNVFTSFFIIKKLKEQGIFIEHLAQALDRLKTEGYGEVLLQPTHLTPGEEYDKKIVAVAAEYQSTFPRLWIGRPAIMYEGNGYPDDYQIMIKALQSQLPPLGALDEIVFMGHGSPNRQNPIYQRLQDRMDACASYLSIGVLEPTGAPSFDTVVERLWQKKKENVFLRPFLFVAGMHVIKDLSGDDMDSWKNKFLRAGFNVVVDSSGLGENEAIQRIYIQHIKDAMQGF